MNPVPVIFGGLSLLIGVGCFFWAQSNLKKAKRIEDTETSPIRNVSEGFVEVKGRVRGKSSLASPLTNKPCVYYRFHVEEHVRRGKNSHWRTIVDDRQDAGCLVEDASQAAIEVNLLAAELLLEPDNHAKSGLFNDAPAELEATLQEKYSKSSQGFVFNKAMRYTETMLEEGDEIYVLGTAVRRDGQSVIDKEGDLFIVSDKTEEALTKSFHNKKLTGFVLTGVFGLGGIAMAVGSMVMR
jgi:hypothetical protein